MPDERDKGLASSIWARASLNTSRPPYYFKRATAQTNSSSHASTTQVSQTGAFVSAPSTTPQTTNRAAATPQSYPPPGETPLHADLNSALRRVPTPWSELARYTKIVRRLRWKLPLLAYAYNAATDESNPGNEQQPEAELMFKLDFFEFYMLLERALVHLLGVFGIKVTGDLGARLRNGHAGDRRGDQEGWQQSPHRFHANVLEALDDPRNPLHGALGADDVRSALARAKELRNRWKNADDENAALAGGGGRAARPLEEYELGTILEMILAGFDHGFRTADQYVAEVRALAIQRGVNGSADSAAGQTDEWEFMTDAMDWEAV